MTIRTHVTCRALLLATATALIAACGDGAHVGTETDNPSPGKPPKYQSPPSFGDEPHGQPPCLPMRDIDKPSRLPTWGQDGALLIGADGHGGLVALDASDAASPQLQSVTPLAGEVHQIVVEPNAQVTLAVDEVLVGAQDEIPTPTALQPVPRLVRFDANDPRAIERVGDVDLEGEFWSMRLRGSTLWVMSETVVEPRTSCNRQPYDCVFIEPIALIVTGYRMQDGAWRRVARAELKTTGPAWALPDGYAAFEARYDDQGDPATGTLHFVRFDGDDALAQPDAVKVAGEVVPGAPIGLTDALLHVFTLDYEHGDAQLDTIALGSDELVSRIDGLSQGQSDSVFVGDRLVLANEQSGETARLIDWTDPAAPSSNAFSPGVTRVVPIGDGPRALGLSQPSSQDLAVSLFYLQGTAPELLDVAAVNQGDHVRGVDVVSVVGDHAVIAYNSNEDRHVSVAFALGDTTLERIGAIEGGYAEEFLISGESFYAPDWSGLHSGNLSGADAHTLSWNRDARDVIDEVGAGVYRATLLRDAAGQNVLELRRNDELLGSLEVGPSAERLIADDAHVLVLSLQPRDQCEQSGLDCSDYAPNAAIVTLGDEPAISATVKITDPEALGPTAKGENRVQFGVEDDVAFALGAGRFVLVASYDASCSSEDECEALGVEPQPANQANVAPSAPAPCAPGASCPPPPAPTPAPVQSVYGERRATRLYLLDAAASKPRFAEPVDSVLELSGSRFAPLRVSQGTLMVTRIEQPGMLGSAPLTEPAHFMLDRFVAEDAALQARTSINVPGFPIALADGGETLFSVEPDAKTQGGGQLYALALEDDGARPLDRVSVDATYSDAVAAFGKVFYLSHDGTDCNGTSTLAPFAVNHGALRALHTFAIPGGRYRIADAQDERLLLTDDRSHYVVLDVSGDTPELVKFLSATVGPGRPTLQGDHILGGASLFTAELDLSAAPGSGKAPSGEPSACQWPARLDRGDDAEAGACHAKRHYLTCSIPGGGSAGCLSDDTQCPPELGATACEDQCEPDEYAIVCGAIGGGGIPDPPPTCRDAGATPGGTFYMCCPCE